MVKNLPANAGDASSNPWVGKIPWRRKWQPTPVLLAWRIPWTEEPGGLQSMRDAESWQLSWQLSTARTETSVDTLGSSAAPESRSRTHSACSVPRSKGSI